VSDALHATEAELAAGLAEARSDTERASLVARKRALAEDGRRNTDSLLARVTGGATTTVIFDWSALGAAKTGLGFTPFGVRAIDTLRTIYTLVPINAYVASKQNGFEQTSAIPTLEDREARSFTFPLERTLTEAERSAIVASAERALAAHEDFTVTLPGAKVFAKRARVETKGGTLVVHCLPAD
jgi:hypothetical protein